MTRSVGRDAAGIADESAKQEEAGSDVVNSLVDVDAKNDREDVKSRLKENWLKAMGEELAALEANEVWTIVKFRCGGRSLHAKWVYRYKTKRDPEGPTQRPKARLVACGNEQEFSVSYRITFAAVVEMTSVKTIFVLTRKWAKHGDVPNAYTRADKEAELEILLRIPQGMIISEEIMTELGVTSVDEVTLELYKALYGLKQAGNSGASHSKRNWWRSVSCRA